MCQSARFRRITNNNYVPITIGDIYVVDDEQYMAQIGLPIVIATSIITSIIETGQQVTMPAT